MKVLKETGKEKEKLCIPANESLVSSSGKAKETADNTLLLTNQVSNLSGQQSIFPFYQTSSLFESQKYNTAFLTELSVDLGKSYCLFQYGAGVPLNAFDQRCSLAYSKIQSCWKRIQISFVHCGLKIIQENCNIYQLYPRNKTEKFSSKMQAAIAPRWELLSQSQYTIFSLD